VTAPALDPGAYPSLKVEDVAQLLGVHIETVRRRARSGKWRAYKVTGEWHFCPNDVDAIAFGEPNVPMQREAPAPRRRRLTTRPDAPGSVSHLDEIEREMRERAG
jgi:excisionase family DNA binding protein